MDAAGFAAIATATFISIFLPLVLSGERSKAAENKARARRIADAKVNARLLRLNL